ncbi:MAG: lipoprotein-releasing ABC transporter permease subunit [Halieaceae bacterium]
MQASQLLRVAGRYTFAWRKGYLSSFLSLLSMLGMILAIALLILVLSVMNGFDREMRDHILALVPQLTIKSWQPIENWQRYGGRIREHPEVTALAPFVQLQGMLLHDDRIDTALLQGIDLNQERQMTGLSRVLAPAAWKRFADDPNGIVLGQALAQRLGVEPGDSLTLLVPGESFGSRSANYQHLRLSATVNSGTELDQSIALLHLQRAASLAGIEGRVHGYRLQLLDLFAAPRVGWELINVLPQGFYAGDWTQTHGNLYAAIQMSRDLVIVLLLSIIAIAAFNVVSSLVLVVVDKRSDIAILRALGARPGDINGIFLQQGLLIAAVGTALGTALGVAMSLGITDFVALLEQLLGIHFLNTDVYPIGYLPADLRLGDVLLINSAAALLCFLAALYPARRAAQLPPAEALRHE